MSLVIFNNCEKVLERVRKNESKHKKAETFKKGKKCDIRNTHFCNHCSKPTVDILAVEKKKYIYLSISEVMKIKTIFKNWRFVS